MLTASDVLEVLFDSDSDFLGLILVGKRVKMSILIVVLVLVLQLCNRTHTWTRLTYVSLHIHHFLDRLKYFLVSSGIFFAGFL